MANKDMFHFVSLFSEWKTFIFFFSFFGRMMDEKGIVWQSERVRERGRRGSER